MKAYSVSGGGGARLHVREWGNSTGTPILLIHGWSQSHQCWAAQYGSELAEEFRLVAFDLRGHGMSEAPVGTEHYVDPLLWAEDVRAVIDQLELHRPVLLGWSYGGFVICDYLRAYSQAQVAGIKFVGAAVTLQAAAYGTLIGPGFLDHVVGATSDDLTASIDAVRAFVRACTFSPLSQEAFEKALCWTMAVAPEIRAALVSREIHSDDVLQTITRPILVSHGLEDRVILPAMSEHILSVCPGARVSWYARTGHAPFLEAPARFNLELAEFAREASRTELSDSDKTAAAGPPLRGGPSSLPDNR